MKKIKLKFADFWEGFDKTDNLFLNSLQRDFDIVTDGIPDYLIYSMCGMEHLDYDCVKIFYTGENMVPDFNLCDYAMGFDYMQYEDRYLRVPVFFLTQYDNARNMMLKKHLNTCELDLNRQFCCFVYSNGRADPRRDQIFSAINTYKRVDSGGKHLNNIGYQVTDKLSFQKGYKFSIACENAAHSGYTTEKIVDSFAAHTVPIYWGDPDIKKVFNKKAFICANDFATDSDLIEYIKYVDNNDEVYLNMLSEPALNNDNLVSNMYDELNEFLNHIFAQEIDNAYRRDRGFIGLGYLEAMKDIRSARKNPIRRLTRRVKKYDTLKRE